MGETGSKVEAAQSDQHVLAIDATANNCTVAILGSDNALFVRRELLERGHAERLFPLIESCLDAASLDPGRISVFAAARGPGSFTGVRIGVSAARGLALAAGGQAIGVDGFTAIAAAAQAEGVRAEKASVVFGKSPSLLTQRFRLDDKAATPLGDAARADPPSIDAVLESDLILGPAAQLLETELRAAGWVGDVSTTFAELDIAWIARLARRMAGESKAAPLAPLYLRPPDAEPSRERRPRRLGLRPSS